MAEFPPDTERLMRQASLWLDLLADLAEVDPADTQMSVKLTYPDGRTEAHAVTLADTIAGLKALTGDTANPLDMVQ